MLKNDELYQEIERIRKEDPLTLAVFVAEYYMLKGDIKKAYDMFGEIYADKNLSPVMKKTVRNYLVTTSRDLRKRDIENIDFEIDINFKDYGKSKITKANFAGSIKEIGALLEILDYYLKKYYSKGEEK